MEGNADDVAVPVEMALPLRESNSIQGNILAPFNKPRQRLLFISFRNHQEEPRAWLKALLADGVASTSQVVAHGEARKKVKENGDGLQPQEWVGVSFTSSGLVTLFPRLASDLIAYDAFWRGPLVDREYRGRRRMSPAVVGDARRGDPTGWVIGGPDQYPVDALVTIAGDKATKDGDKFLERANHERDRAREFKLTVLSWQDCERLEDIDGAGIEPFGFRDGISQPGIRGFTPPAEYKMSLDAADQIGSPIIAAGEFVLGYDGEGGSYPDVRRSRPPEWMRDGSFQVFLRLRQDLDGWKTQMRELTASSGGTFDAGAKAIGRDVHGMPLAGLNKAGGLNNFTFNNDQLGQQTPRFAHIRKMNPRNGTFDDRVHRLLRRGIPFAKPLLANEEDDADEHAERGLAFNAFMASIENQFEFLLQRWASNPESLAPVAADGPDPVVGVSDTPCVIRQAGAEPVEIHFGRFVWTSGAVYAFAPSLETLHCLANLDQAQADGTE